MNRASHPLHQPRACFETPQGCAPQHEAVGGLHNCLSLLPLREKVPAEWQADEGARRSERLARPLIRLKRHPGMRMLPGSLMTINQAMGLAAGRDAAGLAYLTQFVEEMKASGFVAEGLKRHGIEGAVVAPAGGAR